MADVLEQTMPPGQWHRGFAARWESLQRAWVMDKSETRLGSSEAAFTMDQLADLIERYDPQPHMLFAQPGDMPGPGAGVSSSSSNNSNSTTTTGHASGCTGSSNTDSSNEHGIGAYGSSSGTCMATVSRMNSGFVYQNNQRVLPIEVAVGKMWQEIRTSC